MTLIPDSAVPFIILPAVLLVTWYGIKAQAQATFNAAQRPKSQAELAEESRRYMRHQDIKDKIQVTLFFIALIPVGLILLALLVFAFTADFTITPETVIAFLLVCILFKMGNK